MMTLVSLSPRRNGDEKDDCGKAATTPWRPRIGETTNTGSVAMLRNTLRKLTVLTAILGCVSLLAITTGCDESLSNADVKVQQRAAWPLFW